MPTTFTAPLFQRCHIHLPQRLSSDHDNRPPPNHHHRRPQHPAKPSPVGPPTPSPRHSGTHEDHQANSFPPEFLPPYAPHRLRPPILNIGVGEHEVLTDDELISKAMKEVFKSIVGDKSTAFLLMNQEMYLGMSCLTVASPMIE